jgi:hypothetical protein
LAVGAFTPEEAWEAVYGSMPVRTIGGCNKVEMASISQSRDMVPKCAVYAPFWLCSLTAPMLFLKPLSRAPPTECIELAVDPRRGW